MCLDTVDKTIKVTEGVGWKCFDRVENGVLYQWMNFDTPIPTGVWLSDSRTRLIAKAWGRDYPTGFHVFVTRQGCRDWHDAGNPIRKVAFRAVVASGTQEGNPTIVAREIYIHPKGN